LDLNRLYKPAKDSDFCTLDILNDETGNHVSIFDMKRLKGWWPCVNLESGDPELTVNSRRLTCFDRRFALFRAKSNWNWRFSPKKKRKNDQQDEREKNPMKIPNSKHRSKEPP
jgi:hypothetical protein